EVSLTDMNEFRYDNFDDSTLSYMISTRAGKDVIVSLWNYTVSDWVPQGSPITAGSEYQDSVYFTSNDYIDSTTYKVKIKFSGFSGTEFTLNNTSTTWDYTYSYYPAYQIQLDQLNSFRYTNFNESTISYQIDLPIAGKSTDVYLYNFTKLDWDYFKTTTGGYNIDDNITFYSSDYIENDTYNVFINFTKFSNTEFNLDSIVANYSWAYYVQDKYYSVLNDMTTHRYNSFEKSIITFSIQTTENQTLEAELYNFTSSEWTVVGSPFNTVKDTDSNGSLVAYNNSGAAAGLIAVNTADPTDSSLITAADSLPTAIDAYAIGRSGGNFATYAYDAAAQGVLYTNPGTVSTLGLVSTSAGSEGVFTRMQGLAE
ncbi:hypothetical protein LCGC14_2978650, partial [marine sediment metagenome]